MMKPIHIEPTRRDIPTVNPITYALLLVVIGTLFLIGMCRWVDEGESGTVATAVVMETVVDMAGVE